MKRNLIICVLIVACVVATLATIGQVQAKSSVPTVKLFIEQNTKTGHHYFSPTFGCIPGKVASVTIKNMTKQTQRIEFSSSGSAKTYPVKPGGSLTSLQHASDQTGGGDFEIDVELNPRLPYTPEAAAFITADAIMTSPECTQPHV